MIMNNLKDMKIFNVEFRDDLQYKDVGYFILLVVGLGIWLWVVFGSGWIV